MNKNLITGLIVVTLALAVYGAFKPAQVIEKVIQAGAATSPIIGERYFGFGDAIFWGAQVDFTTATTTVCAVQAPAATSTLVANLSTVSFRTSSTSASTVTVAKATTAFATTTLLRTVSIAANAQADFTMGSTTSAASTAAQALEQSNLVFAPNEWLVIGMAGGTGTFSPVGSCSPVWKQVDY